MDKTKTETKSANIFLRTADFIGKDIKAKNESKKPVVVIRLLLITTILYFSIYIFFCIPKISTEVIFFAVIFFAVFIGLFALSYQCSSVVTLLLFNLGMIIWIWSILHFFGWNIGVQHFLMVLLILCFFATYKHYTLKCLYAACLSALRIVFFYMYQSRVPSLSLSASDENTLQIINTLTIFLCITIIALIFSSDGQKLESKLVDYNALLEKQANSDALTGLYNRRKAMEYMGELTKGSGGYVSFNVCICDIDFFKRVNDNYGHDFGDEVLKGVADILIHETKSPDFAARWGGEEFLLLFVGCNGDEAFEKVSLIRRKIKAMRIKKDDVEIGVTMTFGLTEYDFGKNLDASLKKADQNLYLGKKQGRDQIVY